MATTKTDLSWEAEVDKDWIKITLTPDVESSYSGVINNVSGDKQVYVKVIPGGNGEIGHITFTCLGCEPNVTKVVDVQRCGCTVENIEVVWNDTEEYIGNCGGDITVTLTGTKTTTYTNCDAVFTSVTTSVTYYDFPSNMDNKEQTYTKYYPDEHTDGHSTISIIQAKGPCTDGCTCANSITIYNQTVYFMADEIKSKQVALVHVGNCGIGTISHNLINEEYFEASVDELGDVIVSTKKENEGDRQTGTLTLTYIVNGQECKPVINLVQSAAAPTCGCGGFNEYSDDIVFDYNETGSSNKKMFTDINNGDCIVSSSISYEYGKEESRSIFAFMYSDAGTVCNIYIREYTGTVDYEDDITLKYNSTDTEGCTVERHVIIKAFKGYDITPSRTLSCEGGEVTFTATPKN